MFLVRAAASSGRAIIPSGPASGPMRVSMHLYNTMTREKDLFQPRADPVTMYVCGVTPYDTTHLGHARTYLTFDVLQRYLRHLGMSVRYCQNVTDVDDPL